jgi:hypothetical protein
MQREMGEPGCLWPGGFGPGNGSPTLGARALAAWVPGPPGRGMVATEVIRLPIDVGDPQLSSRVGRSRRLMTRIPAGQQARLSSPMSSATNGPGLASGRAAEFVGRRARRLGDLQRSAVPPRWAGISRADNRGLSASSRIVSGAAAVGGPAPALTPFRVDTRQLRQRLPGHGDCSRQPCWIRRYPSAEPRKRLTHPAGAVGDERGQRMVPENAFDRRRNLLIRTRRQQRREIGRMLRIPSPLTPRSAPANHTCLTSCHSTGDRVRSVDVPNLSGSVETGVVTDSRRGRDKNLPDDRDHSTFGLIRPRSGRCTATTGVRRGRDRPKRRQISAEYMNRDGFRRDSLP